MKNKKNDPCPFCNGTNKITVDHDIGFDVWESGEEKQHMDRCACGGWRFHSEVLDYEDENPEWKEYFGKWNSKDDPWFLENFY